MYTLILLTSLISSPLEIYPAEKIAQDIAHLKACTVYYSVKENKNKEDTKRATAYADWALEYATAVRENNPVTTYDKVVELANSRATNIINHPSFVIYGLACDDVYENYMGQLNGEYDI